MPSRTGPKKSRCGSRGRASESGISKATLAARSALPSRASPTASRARPALSRGRTKAATRTGRSAIPSRGTISPQPAATCSRRLQLKEMRRAARPRRRNALANGGLQGLGPELAGEVVAPAEDDDRDAGALDAQQVRLDLLDRPQPRLWGEARPVHVHEARGVPGERA